jgi:hypothetical protein
MAWPGTSLTRLAADQGVEGFGVARSIKVASVHSQLFDREAAVLPR